NGEHALDLVPAGDVDDRLDMDEVDHLGRVRLGEPGRVRVPVDRNDPQPELLRAQDRAPLVASRADAEDGPPSGAMLLPEEERDAVPAGDLAPVSAREARPDPAPTERARDERLLRVGPPRSCGQTVTRRFAAGVPESAKATAAISTTSH